MNISICLTFCLTKVISMNYFQKLVSFLPAGNQKKNAPNTFPELIFESF